MMLSLIRAATLVYSSFLPRAHAAWVAFFYPSMELIAPTVGLIRTSYHGSTYGVYVRVDVPTFQSGAGMSVFIDTDELLPPPLPGVSIRISPSDLGASSAQVFDPLAESMTDIDEHSLILP